MVMSTERYTAELGRRLRVRGLDEVQIRDAVATVEAHLRDTGGSAEESFGSPRAYARTFAPQSAAPRSWRWYVVGWLVAALAGALLWLGMAASREEGGDVLGFLAPAVAIGLGAGVLVGWAAILLVRLTRSPRH